MKKSQNLVWAFLVVSLFSMLQVETICAETYPSKPMQIVVPWSAGDTDLITRLAGSVFPNILGQPAVVLNKPGAQGIIGTDFAAKAPADGYTLLANGPAHLIVPMIQKTPFSASDFIPLVQMAKNKGLILVKKDAPWSNFKEFVVDAKKKPENFKYGSPGKGTWHNFMWEILKDQAGMKIEAVPYNGNAPIVAALLGGHISIALIEKPTAFPHVKGGTLKALAISEQDDGFPGVMTFAEQGFEGDFNNWKALFGRKGIPPERAKILDEAFIKMLADKSYLFSLKNVGSTPGNLAGESFRKFITEQERVIARIVEKVFK